MREIKRRKTKLNREQATLVRELYANRVRFSLTGLAREFGVSKSTIHEIVKRSPPYDFE